MFLNSFAVMATGLRFEYRFDGIVNFITWKARIVLILQENELWEIVNNVGLLVITKRGGELVLLSFY